ncbi:MAG: MAPEG family protein [Almyronema sp.]
MPATLLVCIAIGATLIYLPFLCVGVERFRLGYDMSAPRTLFDKLPPYAQRANWAHQNSFESFALFAPAALMAYITGQTSALALGAAIAYLVARFFYSIFYILDIPLLRSLTFAVGSLSSFALFVISCRSVLL